MKKIFIIVAILVLAPITVHAATINTSFDENECILTVSGTQTGHEAQVSTYINGVFKGMNTDTIEDGKYEVKFTLTYDTDTTIDIAIADELGGNKDNKTGIIIPACTKTNTNTKITELFDNQGNSIIINDADKGFEPGDYFEVGIRTKEEMEQLIESVQGTPNYDIYNGFLNAMLNSIGEGNELKYFIESTVKDDQNADIDYSNYNDGFILNLLYPKDEYKKLNGLKIISVDGNTFNKIDDVNFTYDETNETFVINIARPGALLVYIDPNAANSNVNPNTGDNINKYFIMFIVSTIGLISLGIYSKKKIFN